MMAEIRANREYKFKEFCISEEIPKSPPVKTKRWTFHDKSLNSKIYNRPSVQRKWDEKGPNHFNWSSESNMNQQHVKTLKKPESDLRAEFFNAYKKYYRRVDIKRLEVESTLNVDAKLKRNDQLSEAESSLYKEKECMEINIVMDTEKDDALVSSKVRRTVLCVSPGEDTSSEIDNIKSDQMTIEFPEELAVGDQNIVLGETIVDESGYCSFPERSSSLISEFPVNPEYKYFSPEKQANMTSRLKLEECSVNQPYVSFAEKSQNNNKIDSQYSNNIDSQSRKKLLQRCDKESTLNLQGLTSASCNDIHQTRDSIANNLGSSACQHHTQMEGGNNSVIGADELFFKDEKNKYVNRVENKFCKSKIKFNTKDPVYPTPSEFRTPEEKSSRSDISYNRKSNFKRSIDSAFINCEGKGRTSPPASDNVAPLMFDISRRNPSSHNSEILPNTEKNSSIDSHSKNGDRDRYQPKSDSNEILTTQKKYLMNEIVSGGYDSDDWTTESIQEQAKNVYNPVSALNIESAGEFHHTRSLEVTKNHKALASDEEISNVESGVRFRGLRGAHFNGSNKKVLKSLVVNVIQSDPNDDERNSMKRESNNVSQKEKPNLTQRYKTKVVSNLAGKNHSPHSQKSHFTNQNPVTSSQYCDLFDSNCKIVEVSEKVEEQNRPSDSTNLSRDEPSFTSEGREKIGEPFVIWTNKNSINPTESLKISKLTISDTPSDVGSEYDTNSKLHPFSSCHGVCESSVNNKIKQKVDPTHPQNSEKQKEETYFREDSRTTNRNESNDNQKLRKGNLIPECRYTFVVTENSTLPKYLSHDNWKDSDSKHGNEDQKSEIFLKKFAASHVGKEVSLDEEHKFVSQRDRCEVLFDKKQRSGSNVCVEGENQLASLATRTYETKSNMNDSNRIRNGYEKDSGKIKHGFHDLIRSDKKNLKSSNSDFLQIGPTYSVHYTPALQKVSRTDLICEDMNERCHGGPVNAFHCNFEKEKDYISETRNKTQSRNSCNNSPSLIWDNYLNACNSEMICNGHYKPNSETKSCGHHNSSNNNCCNCDGHSHGSFHIIMKNKSACAHQARDKNLYYRHRNSNNCSMSNKMHTHIGCPFQDGNKNCCKDGNRNCCQDENRNCCLDRNRDCFLDRNRDCCQEENRKCCQDGNRNCCQDENRNCCQDGNRNCCQDENRNSYQDVNRNTCQEQNRDFCQDGNRNCCKDRNINCCQKCDDGQMRLRFKNCSATFPRHNNILCSCSECSAERSIDVAYIRKGICRGTCSVDKQVNFYPRKFDDEKQWMSTGHQPLRASNKSSIDGNIGRPESPIVKEPIRKEYENHRSEDTLYKPSRLQIPESSSPPNHKKNYSYVYDEEPKIACQLKFTENGNATNNSFTDVKTEQKYYHNSLNSSHFNFPDRVGPSDVQEEFKEHDTKLMVYGYKETKAFSNDGKTFCGFTNPLSRFDGKTNDIEAPSTGSDRSNSEPLFLCEERWDSDDGLPIRRIVMKADEGKEEKIDSSNFIKEAIQNEDEHWESGEEEIRENEGFLKDFHPPPVRHSNDFNCLWNGRRSIDSQPVERSGDFLEGEDSKKCSSVHAVSDPSFYCEQQWASDEEKCEDHKFQSTLPKNRTKKRKGRDRRSFNPRRWEMVTDLPKNEYIAKQNRKKYWENNYESDNLDNSIVFQNRRYYPDNND